MAAADAFSEYYAELLQNTYDCVDRIVTQRLLFHSARPRAASAAGGDGCTVMT
jgi:hypothetical protein